MYRKIDSNGFFIEDILNVDIKILPDNERKYYIDVPCPDGLYKPKWDGTAWVEGATAEYIATINKPIPTQPTPEEIRILELEQKNELLEECIAEMAEHIFN